MENKNRQIVIETDGVTIKIVKLEITSLLEFSAIISQLKDFVAQQSQLIREKASQETLKEPKIEEKTEEKVEKSEETK